MAAVQALNESPHLRASLTNEPLWKMRFNEDTTIWNLLDKIGGNKKNSIRVSYHLPDNRWLNLTVKDKPSIGFFPLLAIVIELVTALIILFYAWAMLHFTKQVNRLGTEVEKLGITFKPKHLGIYAPSLIKDANNAVNAMQAKIIELINGRKLILTKLAHHIEAAILRLKKVAVSSNDQEMQCKLIKDLTEIEAITDEMLVFSEQKYAVKTKTKLDMAALIESICNNMQEAGYQVNYSSKVDTVSCNGDKVALRRAFSNLLNNAVKYGKLAEVELKKIEQQIVITIDDQGPGLSSEAMEHVFEPFYRVEHSRSRKTGGTGLGLSVAKDIILQHRGHIKMTNIASGGLQVLVELPVYEC